MSHIAHIITVAVLFVVGMLLFGSTYSPEYASQIFESDVSAMFVPRIYLVIWILITAYTLWQLFYNGQKMTQEGGGRQIDVSRFVGTIVVGSATAFGIMKVGFILATIPGFWAFTWLFGYRNPLLLTAISFAAPILLWIIFVNMLELPLPHSPWFILF